MFYILFDFDDDVWQKINLEEQVHELITSHYPNAYDFRCILHTHTMSTFAKSVKDTIQVQGDMWSNPSENIKVTPSFLAMSAFTDITSISLIKEQNNYNLWYSIDNNLPQRTVLLKSLLTDFEITSMILKNWVFKLMEFENYLDSKKLYPLKPPFHHLLSQNSDVECTIPMTSDLTLHEICKYKKTIFPQDTDDFTQTTIIILTGGRRINITTTQGYL